MTCDNILTLTILYYLKVVVDIIYVIAPILLIVFGMIDFLGAVSKSKESAIRDALKNFVRRSEATVIVLLVPMLVNVVMKVASNNAGEFVNCYNKATRASVMALREEEDARNKLIAEKLEKERQSIKEEAERQRKLNEEKRKAEEAAKKAEEEAAKKAQEEAAMIGGSGGSSGYVSNLLNIPYYNQCDSRWKNIVYDSRGGSTFCSSSCGYTSFAMIAAGLNKDMSINPYTVVSFMRYPIPSAKGYGAASFSDLTNASNMANYGLKAEVISSSKQQIMNALNASKPVIVLVPGHYIVLAPSGNSDTVILLDPFAGWADRRRKSGEYSIDSIYSVYGGFRWAAAYSKA